MAGPELCQVISNHTILTLSSFYIADQLLEYWLGKTEKVSAGSKIGLIVTAAASIAVLLLRRKDNGNSSSGNGSS